MISLFLTDKSPYSLSPEAKESFLMQKLFDLHLHHFDKCRQYRRLAEHFSISPESKLSEYPFVPVAMFKEFDLKSTEGKVKLLTSSGTTGQASKIYVDKETAKRQALSAHYILSDYVSGISRPYLVFDAESVVRGASLGARGAAILSLANFASEIYFVMDLDKEGQLNLEPERLKQALSSIGRRPFLIYGFTYILWQAYKQLERIKLKAHSINPETLILHSGGWKKIKDLFISKDEYNLSLARYWGLEKHKIIDFYGLIEQVGVLYPDCKAGFKHLPYWADIIIRKADTLEEAGAGEEGLIELISLLPLSSPSHSILTRDLGKLELLDNCVCGRRGKAFSFIKRVEDSPERGCSDVYRQY